MDKLAALRAFVEVAESGGFSSASRRLDLAASSVVRSVDALEESLGTVLFNRTTRQVTLSDAGTTYYTRTKKLLDDLAEADASVSDRGGEPSGPLRVSIPVAFGLRIIAPHIASFLSQYPKIDLDVRLSDFIVDLVAERIDVAIRLGEAASTADVVSKRLTAFRRCVVASPDYVLAHGSPTAPEELAEHECLRFTYGLEQQVWSFSRDGTSTRIAVRGRLKANTSELLREAVLGGAGIALLPDWLVRDDIRAGKMTELFLDFDCRPNDAQAVVNALYLPNQRGSRRVGAFIGFISSVIDACE